MNEISTYAQPVDPTALGRLNETRVLVQWAWEGERFLYNPAFRAFVDSIMESNKR